MAIPATLVWCQTQNGIAFRTIHPCLPLLLTLPNRHARHQCCGCCRLVDPPFRAPSHVDKRVSVPLSPLHPAGVPWFWSWQRSWLCSSRKYCRLHEGVTHCHSNAFSSSSFVVVDSFAPKLDFLSSSVVTLFVPCLRVGYRLTCLFVVLSLGLGFLSGGPGTELRGCHHRHTYVIVLRTPDRYGHVMLSSHTVPTSPRLHLCRTSAKRRDISRHSDEFARQLFVTS